MRSFFWSVFSRIHPEYEKYGLEKTQYLNAFHAVIKKTCFKYILDIFLCFFMLFS